MASMTRKPSPADFMFGATLGEGAYARVVHAKMKSSGDEYAVKIMEKRFIKKEDKVKFVMMERNVFSKSSHERIVKLYFTFQDSNYLYMVMELCRGGELLDLITKCGARRRSEENAVDVACTLKVTAFYIAQVLQGLEYLHIHNIIHRDLKPENVLLTDDGHVKITDFGTAKDESEKEPRANTFCGTAEYVSPEVLRDQEASRGCDLWALGCMIFQMLVGRPMFRAENEYLTFQTILNHDPDTYQYPDGFPEVAKDICSSLVRQDPTERLGAGKLEEDNNGYFELKKHPFFSGINWDELSNMNPPYVPSENSLPPADNDGAEEDWLFSGVATELQAFQQSPKEVLENPDMLVGNGSMADVTPRVDSIWNRFILPDEKIMLGGLVSKRRGLFSKRRQLILTSKPRLIYVDTVRMKQKGEIPWSDSIYVQLKNRQTFDIITPNRVYHITDQQHGAQKWADAINEVLMASRR